VKKLLTGNEAIALGAYEAGVGIGSAYPGTPSTEIMESLAKYPEIFTQWAPNEKVALEVAYGASVAGARTLVAMKNVGLNVAADPLLSLSGVNGGLVLVSADDPGIHSSQNEQDNRYYAKFAKILMLEPSDSQEAKDFVKGAFELSENYDTPVMIRITTRIAHSQSLVEVGDSREEVPLKLYVKDAAKYNVLPIFARARRLEVAKRMMALKEYAEQSVFNLVEWGSRELGIITCGISYQYIKEIIPNSSVLRLGTTNPLPDQLIRDFAGQVEQVIIVEEIEPFIEEQVKAMGIKVRGKDLLPATGEFTPELLEERLLGKEIKEGHKLNEDISPRPPLMCPGCGHRGVFHTLKRMNLTVVGDIGCYTLGALKPLDAMDFSICMGASIGISQGMEQARGPEFAERMVAVIGDSTFVHSGITPLINIVYNQGTSTVIILDNGTTAMTGHQDHPATGRTLKGIESFKLDFEKVSRAIGINRIRIVDPLNIKELQACLEEELPIREPSIIIARRPCTMLPGTGLGERTYYVDEDICIGCKMCIELGCTGIYFVDEQQQVKINPYLCVGCGLCLQVCEFGAVVEADLE